MEEKEWVSHFIEHKSARKGNTKVLLTVGAGKRGTGNRHLQIFVGEK